jgi:UDP-N-acetylglucosamine pyrophosphorylase
VKDERFAALYASHDYSIDPTNASFAKTKNMDKLLDERRQRISTKKRSKAKRGPEGRGCMHAACIITCLIGWYL